MKNVKKIGNDFEKEVIEMLADRGYWAYNMPNKDEGKPFDIIAVKNNNAIAIECKHCEKDYFLLSRVEDNQIYAFNKWFSCGNAEAYFVIKFAEEIIFYPAESILEMIEEGKKKVYKEELKVVRE